MNVGISVETQFILSDELQIANVSLKGRLTSHQSCELEDLVLKQIGGKAKGILIDLEFLEYVDSYGLGLLTALSLTSLKKHIPLAFVHASPDVKKIISSSHLHTVLPLYETDAQAMDYVRKGLGE